MQIDLAEVRAELERLFSEYEADLLANRVAAMNRVFWRDPRALRFGIAEVQHGYDEIAAWRAAALGVPPRAIVHKVITTYGHDFATTHIEFRSRNSDLLGRQSQTWVRMPEGWRIVSAHVSLIGKPPGRLHRTNPA
jgi:hypothetical protein